MSNSHDKFTNVDCRRILARSVAVTAGAIAECEYHPCTFVNLANPDAEQTALEIAQIVFSREGNGGLIFRAIFDDCKDMEEMIKQVINESGSTCASCAAVTCRIAGSTGGY